MVRVDVAAVAHVTKKVKFMKKNSGLAIERDQIWVMISLLRCGSF